MINRSSTPRTDLPYLRRRIKPGRAAAAPSASAGLSLSRHSATPAPAPAPAPDHRSGGLVLGGNPARTSTPTSSINPRAQKQATLRAAAKMADHEVALLFAAPGIEDVYELNQQEHVLRLTPLESAVGTLVVSGSTAMAWESVRHVVGGADVDGHTAGSPVTTSGNRPLAGYDGRNALICLRHVRELRRAIFINRGSQPMGVQLFNGATVALPPAAAGTQMVLLLHRIGNVLELRAEPVPTSWEDLAIWQEFDFTMTHQAPVAAYRR